MIIGGALTILFVGGLIFFIGWIVATMGFSSMKPKPTQTSPITPQEVPTQVMPQKKQCLNCGAENSIDAIFCSHCGNKL
jgi:ribosomal protein L40E